LGSIGTPVNGVQMRVVDAQGIPVPGGALGEIQVRGHSVMKGYWNLSEATAEAFVGEWFSTGDIGRVDEDGYFYVLTRERV
jgi:long-chain acyl-CoA synthetase